MDKPKIREVIVVEGRDDTAAVLRAVDAITIETHGFGMNKVMWKQLEMAYNTRGLIVFTDPDHGGRSIRLKIMEKFPDCKEAFLSEDKAFKKGDVGIENATPKDILEALSKAHAIDEKRSSSKKIFEYTIGTLAENNLIASQNSPKRRKMLCDELGIGYSNGSGLVKKLNRYGIALEDFKKAINKVDREIRNE
ncbi:ribonuclease M5 [Eubacteriales bacterium KG127]